MNITDTTSTEKKRSMEKGVKAITAKYIEGIIKKHTSKSGQSIVVNLSKAADEINKSLQKEAEKTIKARTHTLDFKLTCIKQMLENIELKDAKSLSRALALSRPKRKKSKKKVS